MKRDLLRQIVTIIGVVATILVNALANALPINGQQTGEVSDQFPVYFVPAGYVFSIWGLIYLGLIAFAIFQALPSQRENSRLRSIGGLFAVASLANIAWIFAWHYERFPLSMLFMLILLGSLIGIYLRLGTGRTRVDHRRDLGGARAVQHLPGLDHRGDHRQRVAIALCPGLGRLGDRADGLDDHYVGGSRGHRRVDGGDAARRGLPGSVGLGSDRHRAQARGHPRSLAGSVGRRCDHRAVADLERSAPAPAAGGRRPSVGVKFQHRFSVRAPLARGAEFHARSASMAAITPPPMVVRMHRAPEHMGSGDEMDFTLWAGPLPQQAQAELRTGRPGR